MPPDELGAEATPGDSDVCPERATVLTSREPSRGAGRDETCCDAGAGRASARRAGALMMRDAGRAGSIDSDGRAGCDFAASGVMTPSDSVTGTPGALDAPGTGAASRRNSVGSTRVEADWF